MAEEEGQQPPQDKAAQSGLAKEWRKLATWQKAGVVIGGLGLVAGVIYFMNRQAAPTSTGNDQTGAMAPGFTGSPNSAYEGYPGAGDQYPPVPVQQPTGGPTTPTPTTTNPPPITPPVTPHTRVLQPGGSGNPVGANNPAPPNRITFSAPAAKAAPFRTITPQYGSARPIAGGAVGARYGIAPKAAAPKSAAYTPAKSAALQRAIYKR